MSYCIEGRDFKENKVLLWTVYSLVQEIRLRGRDFKEIKVINVVFVPLRYTISIQKVETLRRIRWYLRT